MSKHNLHYNSEWISSLSADQVEENYMLWKANIY